MALLSIILELDIQEIGVWNHTGRGLNLNSASYLLCDLGQYFKPLGSSVSIFVQWDTNDPHFIGLEIIN